MTDASELAASLREQLLDDSSPADFYRMMYRLAEWAPFIESDEHKMLGKPVRIRVEWLDGPPDGFTAESFRDFARAEFRRIVDGSLAVTPAVTDRARPGIA
jgi:hypothetical protein